MGSSSIETRGELTPPCDGSSGGGPLSCGSYAWQRECGPSSRGRDSLGRGRPCSERTCLRLGAP